MDESGFLQDHILKVKDFREELNAIGWKMENEDTVVITLKSLPTLLSQKLAPLAQGPLGASDVQLKKISQCHLRDMSSFFRLRG